MLPQPQSQGTRTVSNGWHWVHKQVEYEKMVGDHQQSRSVGSRDPRLIQLLSILVMSFRNSEGSSMVDFAITSRERE